ncbi:fimbrial biogenesis chaperone [Novosphingobium clariflavum]|uniref:Uncharacterized protein n=1 Tax=Novosphingobium clariflavum TaxID=2029884 RepID=A0ABV6SGZ6_9SPHN|nr:hypothetical protein [Novosphingobium clariflavum]
MVNPDHGHSGVAVVRVVSGVRGGARLLRAGGLASLCLAGAAVAQDEPLQAPPPRAAAAVPEGAVGGMGDINLYPKRVVIDERTRIASVGLYNRSIERGEYDIAIADKVMTADGRLLDAEAVAPGERARLHGGAAMLRWSPRRVVLGGSEAQTIRIMARVAPDTPPGEYRAHFSAVAVPPADASYSIEQAAGAAGQGSIGVRIVPRFGISIPVIVRIGQTTLTAGIESPRIVALPGGRKALQLTITRAGTRSAFGDIAVNAPGARAPLALLKGLGVYTEIDARQVTVPFDAGADPRFLASGAKLTVTYTDDDVEPGKVLASRDLIVP